MAEMDWVPKISKGEGPLYMAIADAIGADLASGRLGVGSRLPSQRVLAGALGIDFTTVTRAYAEAHKRGLVEGRVGQGTFTRQTRASVRPSPAGGASVLVDMSMNLPPRFDDAALEERMWATAEAAQREGGLPLLLSYQDPIGSHRDRSAGIAWLANRLPGLPLGRVLVSPGAQAALCALLMQLTEPGDTICSGELTYPGLLALAGHLRLKVLGLAMDADGLLPDAFETACAKARPKALYTNPTINNPTTTTLPLERRKALVEIARRHDVPIIEDDAYGALPRYPLPPLAALAPERVYHVAGLAKCLGPALRIAYIVAPGEAETARIGASLRATCAMASPLNALVVTRWIEDGIARDMLAALRRETEARNRIAMRILGKQHMQCDREGFHAWLHVPKERTRGELLVKLRSVGIGAVPSDAFAVGAAPEAVRLALGAPPSQEALEHGLQTLEQLLGQSQGASQLIV